MRLKPISERCRYWSEFPRPRRNSPHVVGIHIAAPGTLPRERAISLGARRARGKVQTPPERAPPPPRPAGLAQERADFPFLAPASSWIREARQGLGVFRPRDLGARPPRHRADRRKGHRARDCLLIASALEWGNYSAKRRTRVRFRGAIRGCM